MNRSKIGLLLIGGILLFFGAWSQTLAEDKLIKDKGHFGGPIETVFVAGNYAYVGEGTDLVILDISNPASPTLVSRTRLDFDGTLQEIAVTNGVAYITMNDKWQGRYHGYMLMYDVRNPSKPTEIKYFDENDEENDSPYFINGYRVDGNLTYIIARGFEILDTTNPAQPKSLGQYRTDWSLSGFDVVDKTAYLINSSYRQFYIVDFQNVASPTLVSQSTISTTSSRDILFGVAVANNTAYLLGQDGIHLIDISNRAKPIQTGLLERSEVPYRLKIKNDIAFILDDEGLWAMDISQPSQMTQKGFIKLSGGPKDLFIVDKLAYVAFNDGGLRIIDLSDPTKLREVGSYVSSASRDTQVVGNTAYVAAGHGGLQIMDVSDINQPRRLGYLDGLGQALTVQVVNKRAYIGTDNALRVIDVSNAARPILLGSLTLADKVLDIEVKGEVAYLANKKQGLQLVNIADPAQPTALGRYEGSTWAKSLELGPNVVYLADYRSGLHVVDVSDAMNPTLLGQHKSEENIFDVAVKDRAVYLALPEYIDVIDVTTSTKPMKVGGIRLGNDNPGGDPTSIDIDGDTLIVLYNDSEIRSYIKAINISHPKIWQYIETYWFTSSWFLGSIEMTGDKFYATSSRRGLYTFQYTGPTKFDYYKVSGRVVDRAGQPVEGVAIGGLKGGGITNNDGSYEGFVQAGQHTIYPRKRKSDSNSPAFSFIPDERIVTVPPEATQQDFVALAPWQAQGLYAVTNTLYIADGESGLRLMDISQPSTPRFVQQLDTPGEAQDVQVANGYAYIADGDKGLQIIDVSNPQTLTLVGTYRPDIENYKVLRVVVNEKYGFIVGQNESNRYLHIVDITNQAKPALAGQFSPNSKKLVDAELVGNFVYLLQSAYEEQELSIVDIADPSNPTPVGKPYIWEDYGKGVDLEIVDQYAYIVSGGVFQIVSISDPEKMSQVGQRYITNPSGRLFVQQPYAYIARSNLGSSGMTVMDISNPAQPVVERRYDVAGKFLDVWVRDNYVYLANYEKGLVTLPFQSIPLLKPVSTAGNITPAAGGTAQTKDGLVKLEFPPQAANTALTVTITLSNTSPQATSQFAIIGNFFEITAVDASGSSVTQFNQPFTLTVSYQDESWQNTTVSDETKLQVYFWSETAKQWQSLLPCEGCSHDTETNIFTMTLNHLTQFAILSEQQTVYLPLMRKN